MQKHPVVEAEQYFEDMWAREEEKWRSGSVTAAKMRDGVLLPVEYCLSTIARVQIQSQSPIDQIETVKDQLRNIANGQFFYPLESLHVSLLGCTPHLSSSTDFSEERITKVLRVCSEVLSEEKTPIGMTLRGINILGSQVLIQVFPKNRRWAELRQKLEDALLHIGEEPISYSNKIPIHMNFMRVTDNSQEQLLGILQAIDDLDLRNIEIGELSVSAIELLMTDFMVSVKNRRIYKQFDFQ